MNGTCSQCHLPKDDLVRVRIAQVGLRWMDRACRDRLNAMGMFICIVQDAEPRGVARAFTRHDAKSAA